MSNLVNHETRLSDLAAREISARNVLVNTISKYSALQRPLSEAEKAEQLRINDILTVLDETTEVCDPLFVTARILLNDRVNLRPRLLTQVEKGKLVFEEPEEGEKRKLPLVALTLGVLALDGASPPQVVAVEVKLAPAPEVMESRATAKSKHAKATSNTSTIGIIVPNERDPLLETFTRQFYAAIGEATSYGELAERVFVLLAREGDPDGPTGSAKPRVDTTEFARVMRGLAKRKIAPDEPQLRRRVNEELNNIQNVGGEDAIADLGIDLPDLEDITNTDIVGENVQVMGPMIVAAMFDELKVFQVVDRIVEQFQQGTLPIGPGNAGKRLYRYWRETPNRISEQERKNFAAITLGIPGGDPNVAVNREFNDLWIRFVSSVSSFVRQTEVDTLLRASVPSPISHQQVRKAARDLAGNLSLHGYGMAHYAAREIQHQVQFMIDLLQDPEIRGCYGAKDMWQVVDQVATYDLGGAKTSSRYRTLATCGTIITAWLAKNVVRINKANGPLLDIDSIRRPEVAPNHKATLNPTDYDLVNACELWLADTATTETQIEQFSQPREAPQMTSKPVPMPAMAREMLDGIGDIGSSIAFGAGTPGQAGYGVGLGNSAGYYANRRH